MLFRNFVPRCLLLSAFCTLWILCSVSAHHVFDSLDDVDHDRPGNRQRYKPHYFPENHQHPDHPPRYKRYGEKPHPKPNPTTRRHPCDRPCRHGDKRTCVYNWNAHYARVLGPECGKCPTDIKDCLKKGCVTAGGDPRGMFMINYEFPGPTISVCKHDKIVVTLHNRLDMAGALTIHWHGIHQRGTQWMDGAPQVSQCVVPGSTSFRYEFEACPQGTHFWHAHTGLFPTDGIAGPLIVREPEDPHLVRNHYDIDDNRHILFVQEWMPIMTLSKFGETPRMHTDRKMMQHVSKKRLRRRRITGSKVQWFVNNFIENSEKSSKEMEEYMQPTRKMLINGRSSGQRNDYPLSVFNVVKGKRHRFRVIFSGITLCPVTLSIDQHDFDVIALDGQPIKRIRGVGKVIFMSGERADVVVHANQDVGNYWIHVKTAIDCEGLFGLAVLHYHGAPYVPFHGVPDPIVQTSNKTFNAYRGKGGEDNMYVADASALFKQKRTVGQVRLFVRSDLAQLPDQKNMDDPHWWPVHSRLINGHRYIPQLDQRSYTPPSSPLLTQQPQIPPSEFCSHKRFKECPPKFCKCVNVKDIPYNKIIDLIIYDGFSFFPVAHPIHFHGYFFQVLQSGILSANNTVERVAAELDNDRLNARSEVAPFKDTVNIPAGGYLVLRFRSDNLGPWLLHCHVDFHLENGMALIIRVGKFKQWPKPPPNFPKCGNF